jgi:hypothetical protein
MKIVACRLKKVGWGSLLQLKRGVCGRIVELYPAILEMLVSL